MKKLYKLLLTATLVVTAALSVSVASFAAAPTAPKPAALSAEYTYIADDLKSLGLFGGTEKGYELERVPSRVEASVMLIRMLGKEKAALATTAVNPFSDVPVWAEKYIAYMYEQKLTGGIGGGKFGSSMECSAQMYATFLLRSVGYDDTKGDFAYDKALEAAVTNKVIDQTCATAGKLKFNRGEMVRFSYYAIAAKIKGSDTLLIEKLNTEGALNKDAAARILPIIKSCLQLDSIQAPDAAVKSFTMNGSMKVTMNLLGQSIDLMSIDANMLLNLLDTQNLEASMDMKLAMNGALTGQEGTISQAVNCYIKDGKIYVQSGDQKQVVEMPEVSNEIPVTGTVTSSMLPLAVYINSVTAVKDGTSTIYSVDFNEKRFMSQTDMSALDGITTGVIEGDVSSLELFDLSLDFSVDSNGKVDEVLVGLTFENETTAMECTVDDVITHNADGSSSFTMSIDFSFIQNADDMVIEMAGEGTFSGTMGPNPIVIPAPDLTGYKKVS